LTRIIACMSIFNEAENIKRAIECIAEYVNKVVILDGAYWLFYRLNELPDFNSFDETPQIIESLQRKYRNIKYLKPNRPWRNECEKRSYFFKLGKEDDIFFMLDGDEECIGDIKAGLEFIHKNHAYFYMVRIRYIDKYPATSHWRIRFYRWQPNMRYEGKHWIVRGDWYNVNYVSSDPPTCPQITHFEILNHGHSGARLEWKKRYYNEMIKRDWLEEDDRLPPSGRKSSWREAHFQNHNFLLKFLSHAGKGIPSHNPS